MESHRVPIDIPERESFVDCAGRNVLFSLQCHEVPTGWTVIATELPDRRVGYRFRSFSPVNPYLALGELRDKIRRSLATRYLTPDAKPQLSHDVARGHIEWSEAEGTSLAIDGPAVYMPDPEP